MSTQLSEQVAELERKLRATEMVLEDTESDRERLLAAVDRIQERLDMMRAKVESFYEERKHLWTSINNLEESNKALRAGQGIWPDDKPAPRLTVHALNTAPVGSIVYQNYAPRFIKQESDEWRDAFGTRAFNAAEYIVGVIPDATLHHPERGDDE